MSKAVAPDINVVFERVEAQIETALGELINAQYDVRAMRKYLGENYKKLGLPALDYDEEGEDKND